MITASGASAQDIDWKEGPLGHLSAYIGTYNRDAVMQDPIVQQQLQVLLGESRDRLHANLTVHGPVGFSGTCLTISGNAPRQGGDAMALLVVCPHSSAVEVALASKGQMQVYAATETYSHLDVSLRRWVSHYHMINESGIDSPTYATLISPD